MNRSLRSLATLQGFLSAKPPRHPRSLVASRWWFGPPPDLAVDERFQFSHAANRAQGKRAVGGGLHFTNRRALFTPNVVDASLGGRAWSCALRDIKAAGVEPGRLSLLELFSGGLRSRLRLELRDGVEFFVVSGPADVAAAVAGLGAAG